MTKIDSKKNKNGRVRKSAKPHAFGGSRARSSKGADKKSQESTGSAVGKVKIARVKAKYVHMAPRKVRRIANLLRSISVAEAENILANVHKRAVGPLSKALKSAKANAVANLGMDEKKLFISRIAVDESLTLSRFRPRAQGRAFPIRKRFAHIDISLQEQELSEAAGVGKKSGKPRALRIGRPKSSGPKKSKVSGLAKKPDPSRAVIAETKMK